MYKLIVVNFISSLIFIISVVIFYRFIVIAVDFYYDHIVVVMFIRTN